MSAILIGFRAAGKTTLGEKFAAEKNWNFLDLDQVLEQKLGHSIVEHVAQFGVESFRRLEEQELVMALTLLKTDGHLLATGGGIVDWAPSLTHLAKTEIPKIYLKVDPNELWRRLEKSPERRKIGNLQDFPALLALYQRREPLYEKIASYVVHNRDIKMALNALGELGPF